MDDAEDEIIYMTVDELLTDDHLDALTAADARGVDIHSATSPTKSKPESWTTSPRRIALKPRGDGPKKVREACSSRIGEPPLVSVLVDRGIPLRRGDGNLGTGEQNSLVVVLRAIFTWRL